MSESKKRVRIETSIARPGRTKKSVHAAAPRLRAPGAHAPKAATAIEDQRCSAAASFSAYNSPDLQTPRGDHDGRHSSVWASGARLRALGQPGTDPVDGVESSGPTS